MNLGERLGRTLSLVSSKTAVTAACLVLVVVLGYGDYRTGYEQSFLLFYLLPVTLATWRGNLALGIIFSVLSVAAWIISDVAAGVPAVGFWNVGMALAAYLVFTLLFSKLRDLFTELDERVRARTAALRREIAERERLDRELASVADRERRRLGQELHDSICQHLTGTALTAQTLREKLAARSAPEVGEADKVVRYIEEGIDLSRSLARGLCLAGIGAPGSGRRLGRAGREHDGTVQHPLHFRKRRGRECARFRRRDAAISNRAGGGHECDETCGRKSRGHPADRDGDQPCPCGSR